MMEWLLAAPAVLVVLLNRAPWLVVPVALAVLGWCVRRRPRLLLAPLTVGLACAGFVHPRPGGDVWESSIGKAPTACADVLSQPGVSALLTEAQGAPPATAKLYDVVWLPSRREIVATYWTEARPHVVNVDAGAVRELAGEWLGGAEMMVTDGASVWGVTNCEYHVENADCSGGWRYDGDAVDRQPVPLRYAAHVTRDAVTGRVWWTQHGRDEIAVQDGASARSMHVGSTPWKIDIDPVRRRAYLADWWRGGRVYAIDADTLGDVTSRWVAPILMDVATDSARGRVYVARPFASRLSVLDADTLADLGTLPAPFGVRELDLEPESGRLVAGSFFAARAMIVDADGAVVREIRTGGPVRGVRWMGPHAVALADSACGVIRLDV